MASDKIDPACKAHSINRSTKRSHLLTWCRSAIKNDAWKYNSAPDIEQERSRRNFMYSKLAAVFVVAMLITQAHSALGYTIMGDTTSYTENAHKITFNCRHGKVRLSFLTDDIIRVHMPPSDEFPPENQLPATRNVRLQHGKKPRYKNDIPVFTESGHDRSLDRQIRRRLRTLDSLRQRAALSCCRFEDADETQR